MGVEIPECDDGRTFDFRVLCNALGYCGLQQKFCSTVSAFCDSLALLRHKHHKFGKYNQKFLTQYLNGNWYNAADDVTMLGKVLEVARVSITH